MMIVGGGVFAGIALALLIELFLDQRIKRPVEVRRLLPVPLYLSIPAAALNGKRTLFPRGSGSSQLSEEDRGSSLALLSENRDRSSERLQPYFEALRDRILNRFETNPRKPKLVGVCGCAGASGSVTRLAAGLAGALSEAGDLKVLLVDMKTRSGRPHPILGTRKSCSLAEALQNTNQGEALIAPNLYVASAQGSDHQALANSPSKFTRVVPQLNASDYDYIVFDMPEVDQVSITPRLAKHMDLMLLAVEAERAHRSAVKQAGSLLMEFTPNVAVVLNNTKAGLPKSLHQAA
jgi:Mrp family chromosome partitioning ATPase